MALVSLRWSSHRMPRPGFCVIRHFDFTSPLKLIEERFNLKPLTSRDRDASDMLDCLFSAKASRARCHHPADEARFFHS